MAGTNTGVLILNPDPGRRRDGDRTPLHARTKHQVLALLVFAVAWLLWSGLYQPLILALGAVSCAVALLVAGRTGFFDRDTYSLHVALRLPGYWLWLLREIVLSNLRVARVVLAPHPQLSPTLVTIDASMLDPVAQAILANSITLTPGTVTIDDDQGRLRVHCLTRAAADDLAGGAMQRRLAAITGER